MTIEVLAQLIDEPWNADDVVPTLSAADRTAVKAALIARIETDGAQLESGVPAALGAFRDPDVLPALERVLALGVSKDVEEAAVAAIGSLAPHVVEARGLLRALLDHHDHGVVRVAVEHVDDPITVVLPRLDELAARGDDALMHTILERLLAEPTPEVLAAIARHWDFAITHHTTALASNAIFDALIDHAPHSQVARDVFAAAIAHDAAYARIRGHAALALTSDDLVGHVERLQEMTGLEPSGISLRKGALAKLVKTRRAELEQLAAAGNRTAAKLLA